MMGFIASAASARAVFSSAMAEEVMKMAVAIASRFMVHPFGRLSLSIEPAQCCFPFLTPLMNSLFYSFISMFTSLSASLFSMTR
ncbi:hypothetical protein D9M71_703250 [compost metagenome]